jgi:hypothetical protein
MNPVIFIDVDGPLAWGTWEDGKVEISELNGPPFTIPYPWLQEECNALTEIIHQTDANLVVSSDWRHYYTLYQLKSIFIKYGVPSWRILDTTPTFNPRKKMSSPPGWDRANQIHAWVRAYRPKHWVAIDDLPLKPSFKSLRVPLWRHVEVCGMMGHEIRLQNKINEVIKQLKR